MARFVRSFDAKMDEKGRVFFPAVFRRLLQQDGDEALMICKDVHQNCLTLYPKRVMEQKLDQMKARLNLWNSQHQMVFRQFVAGVDEVSFDGNGRILIPKRMQQQVNLQAAVRFIGMDDTIELWSKDEVDALLNDAASLSADIDALMGSSL